MNERLKIVLFHLVDIRSIILAFAVFNFILIWMWDRNIGGIACVVCPWYHPWSHANEPTVLLIAAVFLRVNRWWGSATALVLASYLVGSFIYLLSWIEDPVAGLRGDWKLIRMDYPYIVGSWNSQYLFALVILGCSVFYLARAKPRSTRVTSNGG